MLGWNQNFEGRFDLGPELGRGSFGIVHVAKHKENGREYAVKVLPKSPGSSRPSSSSGGNGGGGGNGCGSPTLPAPGTLLTTTGSGSAPGAGNGGAAAGSAGAGDAQLSAIEREVTSWMAAQGSEFVARLEGLYEDDSNAYIVQELCGEGQTLKALLEARGGHLPEPGAAAVLRGVLDVLVECHRRGLAYGDVKPANFLVVPSSDGGPPTVRAVDFGCSRPVPLTKPCGSPLYMAPEMGGRRFGTPVDVWAAGVMLYQMLTGQLPFWRNMSLAEVKALQPWAVVAAVRTHDISFPRSAWTAISPEAQQLVAAMLERDPSARITAAAALAHPWFTRALGYAPEPTGAARERAAAADAVEWSARVAALHL